MNRFFKKLFKNLNLTAINHKYILCFFFILSFTFDLCAKNNSYFAVVKRVVDGDTIIIENDRIRLLNVDTEECVHPKKDKNTAFGCKTSNYVKKLLTGKKVRLECKKKRGYFKRKLCFVFLRKENINLRLIKEGWSKYYRKYGDAGELFSVKG